VGRETIPPLPQTDDDYDEDLLESLHLSPVGDDELTDDPAQEEEELDLDPEAALEMIEEEPARSRRPGSETVASTPVEAEAIRRRIARPLPEPELDLEGLDEEDEHVIEEISLEPPPAKAAPGPTFRPYLEEDLAEDAPPPVAEDFEFDGPPDPEPEPPAAAPPPPAPVAAAPPRPAAPAQTRAITRTTPVIPVAVDLVAGPGATEVAIPVEIVLNNGSATVNLNLRLNLSIKLQK